jgi:hypothetical protein
MTPNDFCRWLSGFVELHDGDSISARHWELIKKHLAEVQPEAKTPVYGPLTYPPGVRSAPFTPPQVPPPIGAPPVIYGIAQEESSIPSDCML